MYFLDGNRVLLYKIINWWYYATPGESDRLCGDRVKYVNGGNAKVHHSVQDSKVKITIVGGFAPLLSAVSQCESCPVLYSIESSWQDVHFFTDSRSSLNIEESTFTNDYSLTIKGIDREEVESLMSMETDLVFTLSGRVQGLQNGKIALSRDGDLLEKCLTIGWRGLEPSKTYFTVSRSVDGPVLMSFEIASE